MDTGLFELLHTEGQIDDNELLLIQEKSKQQLVSVHWDLRTMLYLGILLLSSGLGILIYKNIDSIGHVTVVAAIGILCTACFVYCIKKKLPYSNLQVPSPNLWYDYALLLGCLLMVTFVGYLQFQYHAFGMRWGLATFIPMLGLFFSAYYFDHKGVLSMAITSLGAWMGIAVQPEHLINMRWLGNEELVWSGITLGLLLHLLSVLSLQFNIKAHFAFIYKNFGAHVLFVSLIAAMLVFDNYYFLWFLALAAVCAYHIREAIRESAFYFFLLASIYGYVGLSIVVVNSLIKIGRGSDFPASVIFMYFIASGVGLIIFLISYSKQLKQNDSLQ